MRVACLVAVAVLALVSVARADKISFSTGDFAVTCASTGQVCDPPETLVVGDPAQDMTVRRIVYDPSDAHCSSGVVLIAIDGRATATLRFATRKDHATLHKRIRILAGLHTFTFRFVGRTGGCNVGAVASWGGTITVTGHR
jgi:hypothetical protein